MQKLFKKWISYSWIIFCLALLSCGQTQPKLKPLPSDAVILAFGDSLTSGVGAALPEDSYPSQLEKMTGFKVINAGLSGEETRDSLIRLPEELEKYKPQLVIVCLGGNDLLRKRPHEVIKDNLKKIIQEIKMSGAEVVLIAVPTPSLSLSVPDFYQELGEELNIPVDMTTLPQLFNHQEYKSDYIHFNNDGYKAFASDIVIFLKKSGISFKN